MFVLVDLGYLTFYRYHATMRWLEFQKTLDQELTETYILDLFRRHLVAQLNKLQKKYKQAAFLFCKDEHQAHVWRRQLYPDYKGTRGVADDLVRKLQSTVLECVSQYGKVLACAQLEADDIAYLAVKQIRACQPNAEIIVVTSDRDYLQMVDDKVQLVDGTGKWITGSGDAVVDLWTKIIMGDKSDNIPPITKGCGKKTAAELATDPCKLREYVEKKRCADELARNETLVSFAKIPNDLVQLFYSRHQQDIC